jgi:hypothetical protein
MQPPQRRDGTQGRQKLLNMTPSNANGRSYQRVLLRRWVGEVIGG